MKRLVSPVHLVSIVIGMGLIVQVSWADKPSFAEKNITHIVQDAVAQLSLAGLASNAETSEAGLAMLPENTSVDDVEWVDNVLHVYLTLPVGVESLTLSPLDMEHVSNKISEPYRNDTGFGGVMVRVRTGEDAPYRHLEQFVDNAGSDATQAEEEATPDWAVSELSRRMFNSVPNAGLRGPVVNAGRQPVGALSGVVVYCTGGHGWTAGTSSWLLQRPAPLWSMNEDYGNLDQLNYFVHYAFNAGATVVPFRPVGYQTNEIVLDNDDPGVSYTGSWADGTSSKYYENGVTASGVRYKAGTANVTETATARYTPNVTETGFYPVYCFALAGTNRVAQLYRIKHSGGIAEVIVDHRDVGNGWVWLGEYYLEAGGNNYVEISNESSVPGAIIADAIRWGNGMGDIVRSGPGTVSGYPRNEECHRYWAHSELGNNAVGFSASSIWDSSSSDQNDNISTASRWAREMNQVPAGGVQADRWKRVYLEFHSNAFNGSARGCVGLVSASAPTTNQAVYATFVADEVDQDMLILDADFEYAWHDRASSTFTSEFGAISTTGNNNEFDATIVEVAYHDNQLDAELLRDSRVRAALARSSVEGIIRFLASLPSSQVPVAFLPDIPQNVRAVDAGNSDITLSWDAPLSGQANGDPATGYVVYTSLNGYGFDVQSVLGNVLTATVSGVPAGETRYYRIAATNAGGESMPSETLAVRRPTIGTATVLIANGFDRLRRQQNPTQNVGGTIERQIWRQTNSFDYTVQFAQALNATTVGFASCVNEAIIDSQIQLGDYDVALWILGTESTQDASLNSTEQSRLDAFLSGGGSLFISGAELGFDLIGQGNGTSFMQDTLRANYVGDDANTFDVSGAAGGIFNGVGGFDFDVASGAPYEVKTPDVLAPGTDAVTALDYVGGTGGVAGVQYDAGIYRAVTFGFPFEAITSASVRATIMERIIAYLEDAAGPLLFDLDGDGDVDSTDYFLFSVCFKGPTILYPAEHFCLGSDIDEDNDVDIVDFATFQQAFTGP